MLEIEDIEAFILQHRNDKSTLTRIKNNANRHLKAINKLEGELEVRPDKEAYDIAEYLWDETKQRYNFAKKANLKLWAKDIQIIHRQYKLDYALIMAVAKYSQNDNFWRQNVRSGKGLKNHFETLYVKIKDTFDKENEDIMRA